MDAAAEVMGLLADWRRLTEGEHQAIQSEDWGAVLRHQEYKSRLTSALTDSLNRFRAGRFTGEEERRVNACGSELIALERKNQDLIDTKRQHQTAERQDLNETCRNLQGVRRAYGEASHHLWQSYS